MDQEIAKLTATVNLAAKKLEATQQEVLLLREKIDTQTEKIDQLLNMKSGRKS